MAAAERRGQGKIKVGFHSQEEPLLLLMVVVVMVVRRPVVLDPPRRPGRPEPYAVA